MSVLDAIIDKFEDAVALRGISKVDPRDFVPSNLTDDSSFSHLNDSPNRIQVELLRVWIEWNWRSGNPVSAESGRRLFPETVFHESEIRELEFEEQRQKDSSQRTRGGIHHLTRSLSELPEIGSTWCSFRLLHLLGDGAFAKVYLAKQIDMADRLVALKLTFRETNESYWLSKLQHSSIVPIYSVHRHGDVYGICMPYLGNTTLADVLREVRTSPIFGENRSLNARFSSVRRGSLSRGSTESLLLSTIRQRSLQVDTMVEDLSKNATQPHVGLTDPSDIRSEVPSSSLESTETNSSRGLQRGSWDASYEGTILQIGLQLSEALRHAHGEGLLHCDIKPANILLARDGQPRLLDFNVAFQSHVPFSEGSMSTAIPLGGTLPYMSPEHRRSMETEESIDVRSDIYSLGVVLFEMLTGELPYPSMNSNEEGGNTLGQRMQRRNPRLSPALRGIVLRCIEPERENRYRSAKELYEDLFAQLNNRPLIHIQEPSLIERSIKWSRRHPRLSSSGMIATLGLVLLASVVGLLIWRGNALQRSEWTHVMRELEHRIPSTFSLFSSLEIAPHLQKEAIQELDAILNLCLAKRDSLTLHPGWKKFSSSHDRSIARQLTQSIGYWSPHLTPSPTSLPAPLLNKLEVLQRFLDDSTLAENSSGDQTSRSVEPHGTQVRSWIKDQRYEDAVRVLEQSLEKQPSDYVSNWLLGDCYRRMNEYDEAILAYTHCIALRPDIDIAYFNRGSLYLTTQRYHQADADFRKVLEKKPQRHWARWNRAIALHHLGKNEEAWEETQRAVEQGLSSVSLHRLRGEIRFSQGQLEAQRSELQAALACTPITYGDWIGRGLLLLNRDKRGAIQSFEQAVAIDPTSADAYQKLASVHAELGQNAESLRYLEKLIAIEPSSSVHRAGRAVVYARQGDLDEARGELERCVQLSPKEPLIQYMIACGYAILAEKRAEQSDAQEPIRGEELKQAFAWFTRAVQVDFKILSIADGDKDFQYPRRFKEYRRIVEAAQVLQKSFLRDPN